MINNVTVSKTQVVFNSPDPRYPGFPPTIKGHWFTFAGVEDLIGKQIQLWIQDPTTGYFRQLLTNTFLSSPTMFIWFSQIGMTQGKFCILVEPFVVPSTKTNVFTYEISDHDIEGGSLNLGAAPSPFTVAEAYDAGLLGGTTTTVTTTPQKKRK